LSEDRYSKLNQKEYGERYQVKEKQDEINYTPTEGEILHTFIMRTARAIEQLDAKAWKQHVEGNRMWFCHKNAMGCFICQHTQFLHILRSAFKDLAEIHSLSDYKFQLIQQEDSNPRWGIVPI